MSFRHLHGYVVPLRGAALNSLQKMGGSSPEEKWQELVEEMEKRGRKMQVGAARGVLSFRQRSLLSQPYPSLTRVRVHGSVEMHTRRWADSNTRGSLV